MTGLPLITKFWKFVLLQLEETVERASVKRRESKTKKWTRIANIVKQYGKGPTSVLEEHVAQMKLSCV